MLLLDLFCYSFVSLLQMLTNDNPDYAVGIAFLFFCLAGLFTFVGFAATVVGIVLFAVDSAMYSQPATILLAVGIPVLCVGYGWGALTMFYSSECCCKHFCIKM